MASPTALSLLAPLGRFLTGERGEDGEIVDKFLHRAYLANDSTVARRLAAPCCLVATPSAILLTFYVVPREMAAPDPRVTLIEAADQKAIEGFFTAPSGTAMRFGLAFGSGADLVQARNAVLCVAAERKLQPPYCLVLFDQRMRGVFDGLRATFDPSVVEVCGPQHETIDLSRVGQWLAAARDQRDPKRLVAAAHLSQEVALSSGMRRRQQEARIAERDRIDPGFAEVAAAAVTPRSFACSTGLLLAARAKPFRHLPAVAAE